MFQDLNDVLLLTGQLAVIIFSAVVFFLLIGLIIRSIYEDRWHD